MKIFSTLLICILLACNTDRKQATNVTVPTETVSQVPIYRKPEFSRKAQQPKLSIHQIVSIFNEIYPIEPQDKYFTLTSQDIEKIDGRYAVTAFDTSGAVRYFEYGDFEILEYLNSDFSTFAFAKIFDATKRYVSNYLEKTDEGIPVEETIILKSGIVYILKDNYRISKIRRCNDNWKQNEKLEGILIDKLFSSSLPTEKYFIRACCSCPHDRQIQLL